jgi:hypothetical protein
MAHSQEHDLADLYSLTRSTSVSSLVDHTKLRITDFHSFGNLTIFRIHVDQRCTINFLLSPRSGRSKAIGEYHIVENWSVQPARVFHDPFCICLTESRTTGNKNCDSISLAYVLNEAEYKLDDILLFICSSLHA